MRSTNSRPVLAALAGVGLLTLAACGNTTEEPAASAPPDPPTTEAAAAPTDDVVAEPDPEPEPADEPVAEEPAATEPATDEPATDEPADEPVAEEPAVDEPAAVQPAVLGGRAFPEEVQPESEIETNMLPSIVVDDVSRGTKANWRNIFPADRPVLMWMWAPH